VAPQVLPTSTTDLEGVSVCKGAPQVSHLLFADDSLLLMKVNGKNVEYVKGILDMYCANSGQRLSEAKSSIFFFREHKFGDEG
jgi:hypothetical protein